MMISCKTFFRISSFTTLMATAVIVTGCTTTQPTQQCSPKEKARLSSNISSTKAKLDHSKAELSRTRIEISKQNCFSSGKSPVCSRLKSRADKLQSGITTLEGQLAELNATIAGRSHAGRFVQACSASWIPVRKTHKTTPKKVSRSKAPKQDHAKVSKSLSEPVEDFVVPPYETPAAAYAPNSQPKVQPTAYVAPAATKAPTERVYMESSKVRVVGSSFYPDQSKPAGPQAPDHAPAP